MRSPTVRLKCWCVVMSALACAAPQMLRAQDADEFFKTGVRLHKQGDYEKAVAAYTAAIQLNPTAKAYHKRGLARSMTGAYEQAVADYRKALDIHPNCAPAYNDLAWLQATCPDEKYRDGKKSLENAAKACDLNGGKKWYYLGTLAAAYAENGDFDKACLWQAKAIELLAEEKAATDDMQSQSRARLELYKAKKPCRQELTRR